MQKTSNALRRIFYMLFAVCFTWLFGNVIFNNMHFNYAVPSTLISTALWLCLFFVLCLAAHKNAAFLQKHEKACLAAFFVLLAAVQLYFFTQLESYPTRDLEHVFRGAFTYAISGTMDEAQIDYFYKYPNNLPLTIIFTFVFRVARRFGTDAYESFIALASLLNALAIMAAYLFTYLSVRKLKDVQTGFTALFILLLCLPLQFFISFCYTDTGTLWCAPCALYLYLCARTQPCLIKKLALYAALGTALGLGTRIKYSACFTVVAIVIDALLAGKWKHMLAAAGSLVIGFVMWGALFDSFTYAHVLDKSLAADAATPFSSFIMMSMHGDGAFNAADPQFAWSFATKAEKEAAIAVQIKQEFDAFTPLSFLEFLNQKAVRSYGSGNMEYDFTVANSPMRQGFWVECITDDGKYYDACGIVTQGWHVAVYILCIICAVQAFIKRRHTAFVPLLAVFGLFLFLLIWEASQRYLTNYTAMAVICAALAVSDLPKAGRSFLLTFCKLVVNII